MSAPKTCSTGDGRPVYARGLCSRCYSADRRKTPPHRKLGPRGGVTLAPIRLDPREDMLLRAAADIYGQTVAEWVRGAIRQTLRLQALETPQLLALGNDILGVVNVSVGGEPGEVE